MKTDYFGHDKVYCDKRARGEGGWDSPDRVRRTLVRLEQLLAQVSLPRGTSLLEFGCGAGELTLHFARKGLTAYGVDISAVAVEWARQKAAEQGITASFFVGDVTQDLSLPIPPVDLLLDGHCLHCIIGLDRRAFFRNARSYLRPDGLLCVDTMCGDPHYQPPEQTFDPHARCMMYKDIATRYLGRPDDILREVTDAGFSVVTYQIISAVEDRDQDALLVLARRSAGD